MNTYQLLVNDSIVFEKNMPLQNLSPKVIGALLKIFLYTYPIPIITAELPIFFDIILDKFIYFSERLNNRPHYLGQSYDIRELISVLPPVNQAILHLVAEHLSKYKNIEEIATIFGIMNTNLVS